MNEPTKRVIDNRFGWRTCVHMRQALSLWCMACNYPIYWALRSLGKHVIKNELSYHSQAPTHACHIQYSHQRHTHVRMKNKCRVVLEIITPWHQHNHISVTIYSRSFWAQFSLNYVRIHTYSCRFHAHLARVFALVMPAFAHVIWYIVVYIDSRTDVIMKVSRSLWGRKSLNLWGRCMECIFVSSNSD